MVDLILELLRCFALVVRAETCCCLGCSALVGLHLVGLQLVGLSSDSLHLGERLVSVPVGLLMLYRRENGKRRLGNGRSDGCSSGTRIGTSVGTTL